jgi:hypothetical protein
MYFQLKIVQIWFWPSSYTDYCSNSLIYLTCVLLLVCLVTIESTGAIPPDVLFTEAVKILEDKCERVITELS